MKEDNGWISVKEKRPPQHEAVMGWHATRLTTLFVKKWCEARRGPKFYWTYYDVDGSNRLEPNEISHWRPLPEPPKQREK